MTTDAQRLEAIERISKAILEAVQQSGAMGAPGGHLYLVMNMFGMTLDQFQQFMGGLTEQGCLTHEFECYRLTDKGAEYLTRLQQKFKKAA